MKRKLAIVQILTAAALFGSLLIVRYFAMPPWIAFLSGAVAVGIALRLGKWIMSV